jgi:hypothetical protein
MKLNKILVGGIFFASCAFVHAEPMPNKIVIVDKAVVPILKSETIIKSDKTQPVRKVEATILEIKNNGNDVVAREISFKDSQNEFDERQLSIPVIKKGGVIIPTLKIIVDKTVTKDGVVISQAREVDAEGFEFKKGQSEPVKRTLKLDEVKALDSKKTVSHVITTEDGYVIRDIVILDENPEVKDNFWIE